MQNNIFWLRNEDALEQFYIFDRALARPQYASASFVKIRDRNSDTFWDGEVVLEKMVFSWMENLSCISELQISYLNNNTYEFSWNLHLFIILNSKKYTTSPIVDSWNGSKIDRLDIFYSEWEPWSPKYFWNFPHWDSAVIQSELNRKKVMYENGCKNWNREIRTGFEWMKVIHQSVRMIGCKLW